MYQAKDIRLVKEIFRGHKIDLPSSPGVYAFWWLGSRSELMNANRHIVLKGPGERPVDIEYLDWWPEYLDHPCLYVGKSTNIKHRFSLHIKRNSQGRLHTWSSDNRKTKPATTSCQLRFGIEHVFPHNTNPLETIFSKVGFSSRTDFGENAIAERFFEEDRLIGELRPWFNVDSER